MASDAEQQRLEMACKRSGASKSCYEAGNGPDRAFAESAFGELRVQANLR